MTLSCPSPPSPASGGGEIKRAGNSGSFSPEHSLFCRCGCCWRRGRRGSRCSRSRCGCRRLLCFRPIMMMMRRMIGVFFLGGCFGSFAGDGHVVAQFADRFLADPLDVPQIFNRFECAVLGTVIDDGLSFVRADAVQRLQFFFGSRVDIDSRKSAQRECRKQRKNKTENQFLHRSPFKS